MCKKKPDWRCGGIPCRPDMGEGIEKEREWVATSTQRETGGGRLDFRLVENVTKEKKAAKGERGWRSGPIRRAE